jgi:hypothetical protein
MNKPFQTALFTLLVLIGTTALAQPAPVRDTPPQPYSPWFFGGGLGLGFGDVDWIEIYPLIGYRVSPRVSTGLGLTYRYVDDNRFSAAPSTTDYGASLFARFYMNPHLFLEADYEYLSHEFVRFDLSTDRKNFSSALGGIGFSQPAGQRASIFLLVLYDFTHDNNDPFYPYADPWIYRVGVSASF